MARHYQWLTFQDLSGKNNELLSEVGRVKMEHTQRIHRLEQERQSQSDLYDKIKQLEKQIDGKMLICVLEGYWQNFI